MNWKKIGLGLLAAALGIASAACPVIALPLGFTLAKVLGASAVAVASGATGHEMGHRAGRKSMEKETN